LGLKRLIRSPAQVQRDSPQRASPGSSRLVEGWSPGRAYGRLQCRGTCERKMLTVVAVDEHQWRWRSGYRRRRPQNRCDPRFES